MCCPLFVVVTRSFAFPPPPLSPFVGRLLVVVVRVQANRLLLRAFSGYFQGIVRVFQGTFWEPARPLQRPLAPFAPEMPRKSRNCLPGPLALEPRKVSKKSLEQSEKTLSTFSRDSPETSQTVPETFWRLFRGCGAGRPQEDLPPGRMLIFATNPAIISAVKRRFLLPRGGENFAKFCNSFLCTVNAEKDYIYRKIGGGTNFRNVS